MRNKLSLDFAALAVILGTLPLLLLPTLPSIIVCFGLLLFSAFLLSINTKLTTFIAILVASSMWSCLVANWELNHIARYSERNLTVIGTVNSIDLDNDSSRILFNVEQVEQTPLRFYQQFTLTLNWQQKEQRIAAGQQWQLRVSVRPVHSLLNEGGFNFQRWAIANRRALNGNVHAGQLINDNISLRQYYVDKALISISGLDYADLLVALAFGERGLVTQQHQQLLLKTGIAHLMAISGLHISLAAMLGFMLARLIQFCFPKRYINLIFPSLISFLFALSYFWLSGGNPPAMRAMLALTLWLVLRHYCFFCSPWQVWLYIVALLFIYDPLMVLSDSVWLSCCAVAGLIFWFQWMPLNERFYKNRWFLVRWIHLQLAITILLVPVQIAIFQGISLSALLSNIIAVPIASFITVPLVLAAILFNDIAFISCYCWQAANVSLSVIISLLQPLQSYWLTIKPEFILLTMLGWLFVVIWRFRLWRNACFTCIGIILLSGSVYRNKSDYIWRLDMLDVGHGLAIVIHANNRAILYDTGNAWETGSIAEKVIVPFLNRHGLTLEGIILSHEDADHAGGAMWLQQNYPQAWLRTSSLTMGLPCVAEQQWQWQNLHFEVLWPPSLAERADNASSCVIKLSDGQHSVLLTGDLEKQQELTLVRQHAAKLKADILQTPHHGSNTSSTGPFLRAVSPVITLTSISRFNPWRLPANAVKQRYRSMSIDWYSTSRSGQIGILFFNNGWEVNQFRQDLSYRWYNQWFGDMSDSD